MSSFFKNNQDTGVNEGKNEQDENSASEINEENTGLQNIE